MKVSARSFALCAILAAFVAGTLGASAAAPGTSDLTNPKHFFWGQGYATPSPDALTSDIIYHGGNVGPGAIGIQKKPAVYLIYWGA